MSRILTALILIPSVIYVVFSGPEWLFRLVVLTLALLCFHEFAGIAAAQRLGFPVWLGQAMGIAFLFERTGDWRVLLALAMLAAVLSLRVEKLADALPRAAALLFGILYVYGAWRSALVLREHGAWWVFFAVSLNWVGDTAALYAGRAFGKHSLAPAISPAKTWEGAAASAVTATAYGTAIIWKFVPFTPPAAAALVALAAAVAGQVGDLVESAMKRGAGLKDSGTMLPGHGGWLDRLDSTLFSMPVVAFYLSLTAR
jgi:phosphatidate cytidylyltransferase